MKNVIYSTIVILIVSIIGYANAAQEINASEAKDMNQIGKIFVSGLTTPDDVINEINRKAEDHGAHYYYITSLGGDNKFYGTAIIYQ